MIEKKNNNEVDVKIKFNYKDVEKKFADIALKPFESKGKKFIKFVYAKVSDLKVISKNPSRKNVITGGDITEIEEIIKKKSDGGKKHITKNTAKNTLKIIIEKDVDEILIID